MINFDLECPSPLIDYQLCDLEHKLRTQNYKKKKKKKKVDFFARPAITFLGQIKLAHLFPIILFKL